MVGLAGSLRQAFEFTNSYCVPQPKVLVFRAHEKFGTEERLTDEGTSKFLGVYLEAFRVWTLRFAG